MLTMEFMLACLIQATERGRLRWRRGFRQNCFVAVLETGGLRIERCQNALRLIFLDGTGIPRWEFFLWCRSPHSLIGELFDLIEATEKVRRQVVKEMLQELNG
jgi:hypothetical protein